MQLSVFISKFIFLLISEIGLNYLWSINFNTLVQDVVSQDFKYVNALKFTGLIDQIGTFLIPAIVIIKLNTGLSFLTTKPSIKDVYVIGYSFIILLACTNLLTLFSHNIDLPFISENWKAYFHSQQLIQETIQTNLIGNSSESFLINIFVIAYYRFQFFLGEMNVLHNAWCCSRYRGCHVPLSDEKSP